MALCPKCRMTFAYSETHVCAGRDYTKVWLVGSVVGGALVGATLGLLSGPLAVRQVCDRPGASNLCGLLPSLFLPGYVLIGAVTGALVAAAAVILVVRRRQV
jgi:hypothetical protein